MGIPGVKAWSYFWITTNYSADYKMKEGDIVAFLFLLGSKWKKWAYLEWNSWLCISPHNLQNKSPNYYFWQVVRLYGNIISLLFLAVSPLHYLLFIPTCTGLWNIYDVYHQEWQMTNFRYKAFPNAFNRNKLESAPIEWALPWLRKMLFQIDIWPYDIPSASFQTDTE